MSDQARVSSLEALKDFRAAMAAFGTGAQQSLVAVDLEIRRMMEWLTGEQYSYWKMEIRRREEALAEAKMSLSQARISTMTVSGAPAPCTDQQVAVQKAKVRLHEAEDKFKCVQRWARIVEEEMLEYQGPQQQLMTMLEGELPVAYAELDRYVDQLEAYLRVAAPSSSVAKGTSGTSTPSEPPPVKPFAPRASNVRAEQSADEATDTEAQPAAAQADERSLTENN